jgi:hypothetical protein
MPDMDVPAPAIDDPADLLERIALRNARLLDQSGSEADPIAFVQQMAGRNRADLRRLAELIGHDISDLIS